MRTEEDADRAIERFKRLGTMSSLRDAIRQINALGNEEV